MSLSYPRVFRCFLGAFFIVCAPICAHAHTDAAVSGVDAALNHAVRESMPAVYHIAVSGRIYATDTKVVEGEDKEFGFGTAFGVTKDGLVLSKMHVVDPQFDKIPSRIVAPQTLVYADGRSIDVSITLHAKDGKEYKAVIVAGDPTDTVDLVLLQIVTPVQEVFPMLVLKRDASPLGYDNVFTIGSPLEKKFTVGVGIISNTDPDAGGHLQTTALTLSGSSGGPLIRLRDHLVVGIMDSTYNPNMRGYVSISYATPAPAVVDFLDKELRRRAAAKSEGGK